MKKFSFALLALLMAATSAQAASWKVGPSSVAGMDFASINAAMEAETVAAGDTLYLDQYYNESAEQTITKAVVIIGTGYDNSFNDEQVVAKLTNNLNFKTNKAIVKSVYLKNVYFFNDNCTLERCYANFIRVSSAAAGMNHVYSCYIQGRIEGYSTTEYSKMDIQNCVVYDNGWSITPPIFNIAYLKESIINNNVVYKYYNESYSDRQNNYSFGYISNSSITNNIIYGQCGGQDRCFRSDVYTSGSGNTIEHNVMSGSITNFPTNKMNWREKWSVIFVAEGNYSNYYKLATENGENPAIGYATDGGDIGAHGGMFGCPSGGRPQYIPYFTKVQVASKPNDEGKLPVTVKLAIQSE